MRVGSLELSLEVVGVRGCLKGRIEAAQRPVTVGLIHTDQAPRPVHSWGWHSSPTSHCVTELP